MKSQKLNRHWSCPNTPQILSNIGFVLNKPWVMEILFERTACSVDRELLFLLLLIKYLYIFRCPAHTDFRRQAHTHIKSGPVVWLNSQVPLKTLSSRINKHFRTWITEVHKVPSWSCTSFNLGYVTISFQPPFSNPSSQHLEFWTQQHITSSHVLLFFS